MEKQQQQPSLQHRGRIRQIPIYLGKFFRMFIYLNDWKVLPMAALISGLVCLVAATNFFVTQEGTIRGGFAIACICIWNGFFNSIQVICRERAVVKREHRAGMHISSYIAAHMIYQGFICLLQTAITLSMFRLCRIPVPARLTLQFTFSPYVDLGITIFLLTFAADMTSLWISALVKNTTAAMTVMPFILIFEILFAGFMFPLQGAAAKVTDFSLAKWGLNCLCAQADYNDQPSVTVWNQIVSYQDYEYEGTRPFYEVAHRVEEQGKVPDFEKQMGQMNAKPEYAPDAGIVLQGWGALIAMSVVFAGLSIAALEGIDRDKR